MSAGVSPHLPYTGGLPLGREWPLRVARLPVAAALSAWWRVQVHGEHHVPSTGPVILAANHIGVLDGPSLVALTRRLTFALAKHELFVGVGGRLLADGSLDLTETLGPLGEPLSTLNTRSARRAFHASLLVKF